MRSLLSLVPIVLLPAVLPSRTMAQEPRLRLPGPSTVTGELATATASHGGTTEKVLLLVTATRTLLLTGAPTAQTTLAELVGKRVVATGAVVTEHPGEDGPVPIEGKVGRFRYQGNLMLRDGKDVRLQPVTELVGVVEKTEITAADGKRKEQRLQLVTAGERPTTHTLHPAAAKTLKAWLGKSVRVRAWVGEDGIDAVETVAAADPAK